MARTTSVLIVTYNHASEIEECVRAALAQDEGDERVEVIVIDNASSDGTADVAAAVSSEVVVVRLGTNTGFAHGMNVAAEHATGSRLLLLNPDCVMDRGCLAALHAHLDAHPDVGIAAAVLRNADGTPQLFARRDLDLPLVLWTLTEAGRRADLRWRDGRGRDERAYRREMEHGVDRPLAVFCAAGACILLRRDDAGAPLFDEGLPLFFNDADLSRRLSRRGLRTEVVPGAGALHGYGTSVSRADRSRIRADFTASMLAYVGADWPAAKRVALWLLLALDGVTAIALGRRQGSAEAVQHGRGTLGGLGLSRRTPPWLARPVTLRDAIRLKTS